MTKRSVVKAKSCRDSPPLPHHALPSVPPNSSFPSSCPPEPGTGRVSKSTCAHSASAGTSRFRMLKVAEPPNADRTPSRRDGEADAQDTRLYWGLRVLGGLGCVGMSGAPHVRVILRPRKNRMTQAQKRGGGQLTRNQNVTQSRDIQRRGGARHAATKAPHKGKIQSSA
jgi:hypothetical protein